MRTARKRKTTGQQEATALLLLALAAKVQNGEAKANLRIEDPGSECEIWILAAAVTS